MVQVSDWGARPLSEEQKQYAGSDAHVLTALADKILSASGQVRNSTALHCPAASTEGWTARCEAPHSESNCARPFVQRNGHAVGSRMQGGCQYLPQRN